MKGIKAIALAATIVFGVLEAAAVSITPSNRYTTRTVSVGAFDAVRTNTSIDIEYTVGPRKVEVYAPDNLSQYIQVALKGTELVVNYKENMNIKGSHKSYVKVSAPDVTRFTSGSSGNITIKSTIKQKGKTVELNVLSAGDIKALNIEAADIKLRTNSSGDIDTGTLKADNVSLLVNSAGDIETKTITARKQAKLIVNSSGDIEVPEVVAGEDVSMISNSAGDVEAGAVSTPMVSINANSSGNVSVSSLKADDVKATSNSTGNVDISGICSMAVLTAKSSGNIKAHKLKAKDVSARTSSAGNITCHALEMLDARRTNSGTIRYTGDPTTVKIDSPREEGIKPF